MLAEHEGIQKGDSPSLAEWKLGLEERIEAENWDVLYKPEVIETAAGLVADKRKWKPFKRWLREKANGNNGGPGVGYADDWFGDVREHARAKRRDSDGGGITPGEWFDVGDAAEVSRHLEAVLVEDTDNLVYDEGGLWRYNPDTVVWEPLSDSQLSAIVQSFSGADVASANPEMPPRPLKITDSRKKGAITMLEERHDASAQHANDSGFFEDAPRGVMFANTFVRADLAACELKFQHPAREHRARHRFAFEFNPEAECPRFDGYLESVFEGDPDGNEKAQMLCEYIGAVLLQITTEMRKCLVLHDGTAGGDGANGKSVCGKILRHILPAGSVTGIPPQKFAARFANAELAGKLLNFTDEMPETDILEGDTFKQIITGEKFQVERKHRDPFDLYPRAGHIMCCNRLPAVKDTSGAFWERIEVLDFNRRFTEVGGDAWGDADPTLVDRIVSNEVAGVVARFINAAHKMLNRTQPGCNPALTIPASSVQRKRAWRRQSNSVEMWLCDEAENYSRQKGQTMGPAFDKSSAYWQRAKVLYSAYTSWCEFVGCYPYKLYGRFGQRLRELVDKHRTNDGRYYCVKLKPDRQENTDDWREEPHG